MDISLELSPEGKMIAKGAAGCPVFVNRIDPLHPEGTGPMGTGAGRIGRMRFDRRADDT